MGINMKINFFNLAFKAIFQSCMYKDNRYVLYYLYKKIECIFELDTAPIKTTYK